ncbi:hypothetical protein A0126_18810 (plasmid) [Exiguobacterium sp. N4-1P]|nr:hypothetical protein A0126_15130 [Exiguobacterium sp. N4-1P]ASI37640.1 hypothetical protein A0126_18810 [Exiguobacterium sp. N4-1P]
MYALLMYVIVSQNQNECAVIRCDVENETLVLLEKSMTTLNESSVIVFILPISVLAKNAIKRTFVDEIVYRNYKSCSMIYLLVVLPLIFSTLG